MSSEEEETSPSPSVSHLLSLPPNQRTEILHSALSSYPTHQTPKLTPLSEFRYNTLPSILKSQSQPHLTKPQLLHLLEWKLTHGKFRPTLKKLVDSNSEETIEEITRRGLQALKETPEDPIPALKILTELRGIGPATASLILSVADPEGTVFLGDEVSGWVLGDWGRKLKYNFKEYLEVFERVREVKGKLGLSATEVEKVGYVFGRRRLKGKGVGGTASGEKGEGKSGKGKGGKRKVEDDGEVEGTETKDAGVKEAEVKEDLKKVPASSGKKAKVEDISPPPTTGTRRSTRSKKS